MITNLLQVNIDKKEFENGYIKQLEAKILEQQKEIKRLNSIINTDNIINKERAELIEQQRKEIENTKWYAYQMKARISEDIADYIDDGKEENISIIGELKETRKQWQDIEKLLNGESKDNLYNDWRKYGEYE